MTVSKKRVGIILLGIILVISLVFGALAFRPNSASAAESDFYMVKGASIRVDEVTGIRFMARLKASAYDESATYGMLICPSSYLSGIEIDDETDYLAELSAKYDSGDIAHMPVDMECLPTLDENDPNYYIVRGTIAKVKYNNLNREFTGIAYKRTGEEGSYLYEYADVNPSETSYSSRSISYVATASWNAGDFSEPENEDKLNTLKSIVFKSVAQKAGDTEETADGILSDGDTEEYIADNVDGEMSAIAGTIPEAVYSTGNAIELTTAVTVSDKAYNANVKYVSDNTAAVSVTDNVITMVGAGTATISAKVGDKVVDSKTIAVKILSLNSANYMAVGGDNAVSLSETAPVTYSSSDSSVLTVAADGTVTALKDGSATITASINGGEVELEHDVRVIDFGYTTGVVKNFASEDSLDLWKYRDGSNDGNASITYKGGDQAIAVAGGTNYFNVLDYNRPSNTGNYRTLGNMLYLSPEIIDVAKALGYKYLAFYIYDSSQAGSGCRSYAVDANGKEYYNTKSTAGKYYNNGYTNYFTSQTTGWAYKALEIQESDAGTGVGFFAYGTDLYLTMVKFIGADISDNLVDFLKDSDGDYKFDDLLATSKGLNALNALNDRTVSFEYSATGGHGGAPGIIATRDMTKSTGSTRYNAVNSIYFGSDLIQAAKALDCTKLAFRIKVEKWDSENNKYITGDSYALLRQSNINTQKKYINRSADAGTHLIMSISDFAEGETLNITWVGNSRITITDITFRTADHVTGTNISWS